MKLANKVYGELIKAVEAEAILAGFIPVQSETSDSTLWVKTRDQVKEFRAGNSVYMLLPKRLQKKINLAMRANMALLKLEEA